MRTKLRRWRDDLRATLGYFWLLGHLGIVAMQEPKVVERERPPQVGDDDRLQVGTYIHDGARLYLVDGYHQTGTVPVPTWRVVLEDQQTYERRQELPREITKRDSDWELAQAAPETHIPAVL